MSRSKLQDKHMQDKYGEGELPYYKSNYKKTKNKHKNDEAPKNKASKYVTSRCGNVEWLQEPSNFCGHKPHTEGHRMVSGIVRSKVKNEIADQIDAGLAEYDEYQEFETHCGECYFCPLTEGFENCECPFIEKFENGEYNEWTRWQEIKCDKFYS